MKRYLFGLIAMLIFGVANAQVATDAAKVSWTNATQKSDGTPVDTTGALALKGTRIQRSITATCATAAFTPIAQTLNVPLTDTSALFEHLTPAGKHCFRLAHVLQNDSITAFSAVVSKVIVIPVGALPKAPAVSIE